ncbi:DEAD-box ATP-dependent RNA helicase 17 [Phragmites australis]|uniref:DEAD-box ATP-dependent RNA helicase 17 n=1 Tax=Phragmites australis TaxID=29695 RepID=UPI002D7912E7|nr:DEAD-box ATP-dependent RNA helicase 17 [Phragmites australis]XP_062180320.1 DEAD-box ATP-dependent RNA helicase 17 [Phragmites australis]
MPTAKSASAQEEGREGLFASCSFSDLGLHPTLCAHLQDKMGFQAPTRIQAQAIPVAMSGQHMLVKAATGTGKTLAYLAPIVQHLQMREPRVERTHGTFALVLVPTRELCLQVYGIAQQLVHRFHWIVPGYVMGGENRAKEKARLRKGISILIATPGRLLDHLQHTSSFVYSNLRWIVFDEADSILELGFGKAVEDILEHLGSRNGAPDQSKNKAEHMQRQNLLLSATLNEKVNRLAKISLKNPVMIGLDEKPSGKSSTLGNSHTSLLSDDEEDEILEKQNDLVEQAVDDFNLPAQLIQRYVKVSCGSRLAVLLTILKSLFERQVSQKVVVFLSTCVSVDFHHTVLSQLEWSPGLQLDTEKKQKFLSCKVFRLHGNMDQDDRKKSFLGFGSEKSAILVSTDIAARGLDFPKVKCIIQYDSPGEASEYVHRVGRTARIGEKGEALLFLQPVEIDYLKDLELHGASLTEYLFQKVLDSFPVNGQKPHKRKQISLDMHPWIMSLQRSLESFVAAEAETKKLARDAFCSWVRAYTAHRGELKKIFMVKKLHLGHVARSFGLKEQPSLVGRSHQVQLKKRKKEQKRERPAKRRKLPSKK